MKYITVNGRPVAPRNDRPLVSRTAILILSSVLIGTAIGHGSLTGPYFYGFTAGITGLISFLGLDYIADRRAQLAARRSLQSAESALSNRIERHVFEAELRPLARPPRAWRHEASWLPVNIRSTGV